jgi:hypothetical protein
VGGCCAPAATPAPSKARAAAAILTCFNLPIVSNLLRTVTCFR